MADEDSRHDSHLSFDKLHHEVQLARSLYEVGEPQEAVRKAAERFKNRVAEQADRPDLNNRSLMNHVFSEDRPILAFHEHRDSLTKQYLHNGFRFLAVGLAVAVRNPYTHEDDLPVSQIEAMEWLAFISAMHRRLDRVERVVHQRDPSDA